jgi:outer membrane protein OmpA-like peptidoglycan-associated protein
MWTIKNKSKSTTAASAALVLTLAGCSSAPFKELKDARQAVQTAQTGTARQWDPAQLHEAKQTLTLAEKTFEAEGDNARTRDRAYVAMRQAQIAQVQGQVLESQQQIKDIEHQKQAAEAARLAALQGTISQQQVQLAQTERERDEAQRRAEQMQEDLAKVASVKNDPMRGTLITLSGAVLFRTGKSELLPDAESRLDRVATALTNSMPNSKIVIEGYTDARGSKELNLDLSARRAEAVRGYLVSQGVAEDRISAKGLGFANPVAPNKTASGRAENRRVEIVVQPAARTGGG